MPSRKHRVAKAKATAWKVTLEQQKRHGERVIAHFDVDFAPCSCKTHAFFGIPCISVAVTPARGRVLTGARCLNCDSRWVPTTRGGEG